MDKIIIQDLEVRFRVGVPDAERANPQRLLITVELEHDISEAAATDDLAKTIDYYSVSRWLLQFGGGRDWKLIETLACEIASTLLVEYQLQAVTVEVKKFIIPEARHVAVRATRSRPLDGGAPR